jgi:hypothetical protein
MWLRNVRITLGNNDDFYLFNSKGVLFVSRLSFRLFWYWSVVFVYGNNVQNQKKNLYSTSTFLGPKWHSPVGSMPFHRAQKVSISRAQPPPTRPRNGCCPHQKHYARGRINHRCIKIAIMIMGIPIGSPFGGGLPFLYDQRSISSLPFCGYWMIYSLSRGRMIWLHPRPLPPRSSVSSTSDTQKDW